MTSGKFTFGIVTVTWAEFAPSPKAFTPDLTYNVKRSRTNSGPYTIIASSVTEGVTATTYTDSAVTNGGTYYYVVSGVNAFGEGANSAQVNVTMPNVNLPDVVVTAVGWTPNPPYAGNHIVFPATVKNQGTAPTPAGPTHGVGFSIDGSRNVSW